MFFLIYCTEQNTKNKMLSPHKSMIKHSEMEWKLNVSKANELPKNTCVGVSFQSSCDAPFFHIETPKQVLSCEFC